MNSLLLKAFRITFFIFSISVILTMYSMKTDEEGASLLGLSSGYFLMPLLAVNLLICINNAQIFSLRAMTLWIAIWAFLVSLNVLFWGSNKVIDLIRVNIWTTSFFAAYALARTNTKSIDAIKRLFVVIYIVSFVFFWLGKLYQKENYLQSLEGTSNAIYCVVTIVPFIMLLRNKKLVLFLLVITLLCTLFSNKRGASVIMALILIPSLNDVFAKMRKKIWRNISVMAVVIVVVGGFFYLGNNYGGGTLLERFNETEETGGSGRVDIWSYTLYSYNTSSFVDKLFGHGHYAVSGLGDATAAHNDFIEVLYDYGIIGLLVYLGIHIYMIKKSIYLRKTKNQLFYPYVAMYLIFFTMSMVSILIVQQRYLIYMAVFWGLMEGRGYNYQIKDN